MTSEPLGSQSLPEAALSPSDDAEFSERVSSWYQRASDLRAAGRPAEAAELLARAVALEPTARQLREAMARAQFDAKQFVGARTSFGVIVAMDPVDDYALFGLGLSESRLNEFVAAAEHLALAVAMRPDDRRYVAALDHVRATLRYRLAAASEEGE